jgi:biotin transport system substrate-specific component
MLRTLPNTRAARLPVRLAAVAAFTALTALSARLTLEIGGPVPFTLQVLVVLLSGHVLGWRDGALSQVGYLGLIALNLPVDSRMIGSAALLGPTAGFLVGFVPAAALTGLLSERGQTRIALRWLAGIAGVAVIYAFGVLWLSVARALPLETAWAAGAAPFIFLDGIKALLAAGLSETARALLKK